MARRFKSDGRSNSVPSSSFIIAFSTFQLPPHSLGAGYLKKGTILTKRFSTQWILISFSGWRRVAIGLSISRISLPTLGFSLRVKRAHRRTGSTRNINRLLTQWHQVSDTLDLPI